MDELEGLGSPGSRSRSPLSLLRLGSDKRGLLCFPLLFVLNGNFQSLLIGYGGHSGQLSADIILWVLRRNGTVHSCPAHFLEGLLTIINIFDGVSQLLLEIVELDF